MTNLDHDWAELDEQAAWEEAVRAIHSWAPWTTLIDYALGLTIWSHTQGSPPESTAGDAGGVSGDPAPVPRPVVCLVALAAYDAACTEGLVEPDLVALAAVAAALGNDHDARRCAARRPGAPFFPDGRLRHDDQRALEQALDATDGADGATWRGWRDWAWWIVEMHHADHPDALLRDRISMVRRGGVRAGWYDHPELPAQVQPDEPDDARM